MAVQTVTAPTRQPREHGLRSVAEFEEDARLGANQTVTYEALPCGLPQPTIALCWEDLQTQVPKEGDQAGWGESIFPPFAQYAGVSCFLGEDQGYAAEALSVLDSGDEDEVSSRIADWVTANGVDLGEMAKANLALAEVEEHLRNNYRGRGTIIMSAYTAMVLDPGLKGDGDEIVTATGTRVGILPGLPRLAIMGVGALKVVHSPTRQHEAPDYHANMDLAIAERIYTVLVDCDYASFATIAAPTP